MKFKLEIDCDNDTFYPDCKNDSHACVSWELSLLLRKIADDVRDITHVGEWNILDTNGNTVGKAEFIDEEPTS